MTSDDASQRFADPRLRRFDWKQALGSEDTTQEPVAESTPESTDSTTENEASETTSFGGAEEEAQSTQSTAGEELSDYRDDLTAPDPATRETAVCRLAEAAEQGPLSEHQVVDVLANRLNTDDAIDVRVAICESLGELGTAHAQQLLEDYRLAPTTEVSRAASRALRQIDEEDNATKS